MTWVNDWDSFVRQSEDMVKEWPHRTRFVTKFRGIDSLLELKVTNDIKCIKHKSNTLTDLKKFDKLNKIIASIMCGSEIDPVQLTSPTSTNGLNNSQRRSKGKKNKKKVGSI